MERTKRTSRGYEYRVAVAFFIDSAMSPSKDSERATCPMIGTPHDRRIWTGTLDDQTKKIKNSGIHTVIVKMYEEHQPLGKAAKRGTEMHFVLIFGLCGSGILFVMANSRDYCTSIKIGSQCKSRLLTPSTQMDTIVDVPSTGYTRSPRSRFWCRLCKQSEYYIICTEASGII
jgi:hypothetical protein